MSKRNFNYNLTIRIFDIFISFFGIILLSPIIAFIYLLVYLENKSPLFYQEIIGIYLKKFILIKFRTMKPNTNICATHLVDPNRITKIGVFLRKTKIDEIPQLWNVLRGDMSMVGPRPCLTTQTELINFRKKYNLYSVKPGITGIAQIKKIDMSDPEYLAKTEYKMISKFNRFDYFYYIFLTFIGVGFGDRVRKK